MADAPSLNDEHRKLHRSAFNWYLSPSNLAVWARFEFSIGVGVTADFAKHRGMRRVQCISMVAVSFIVSQLVGLRVRDVERLQYAVILVGVSYGAVFGLMPIIVIEWFGMGASPRSHDPLETQATDSPS